MLKNLRMENKIKGLTLSEELEPQTHQQFVDDTMLMGPSMVQEARGIKEGLDTFMEAIGLEINKTKSQVYFFNTSKIMKKEYFKNFGLLEGHAPFQILRSSIGGINH